LETVLRGSRCGGRVSCDFDFGQTMKYVFIDLDGTLFNNKKGISAANLSALEKAKSKGIVPVICSGRCLEKIENLGLGIDFFIFNNGAGIWDCKRKKIVYKCCMRPESCAAIRDIGVDIYHNLLVYEIEGEVVQMIPLCMDANDMRKIIARVKKIPHVSVPNQSKSLTDPNFPADDLIAYGGFFCDINDENCSKGNGILKFAEIYKVKKEDCIAIGDDMNDLTMFDACGYNVAMGNAIKPLKERADFVTDTNENDGVAKFLEKLINGV
jgi:hydroxymethylpyrimidine pyrophosphatase-like HAD family hydrolase